MIYIPGAKNHTSDALSRHPAGITNPPLPDDNTTPDAACPHHNPRIRIPTTLLAGLSTTDPTADDDEGLASAMCAAIAGIPLDWESLQVATAADTTLQELATTIENGPPNARPIHTRLVPIHTQPIHNRWCHLPGGADSRANRTTPCVPQCTTRCPPRDQRHDGTGGDVTVLARHHTRHSRHP